MGVIKLAFQIIYFIRTELKLLLLSLQAGIYFKFVLVTIHLNYI